MPNKMPILKPCPFCGGEAKKEQEKGSYGGYNLTSIYCQKCSASASNTEDWNTRHEVDNA